MGALGAAEEVTPLGEHLTAMPVDPRVGKMLVHGALLRCAGPALTIAAAMGHGRPLFYSPADKRGEAQVQYVSEQICITARFSWFVSCTAWILRSLSRRPSAADTRCFPCQATSAGRRGCNIVLDVVDMTGS